MSMSLSLSLLLVSQIITKFNECVGFVTVFIAIVFFFFDKGEC